jgi:hypothetical protein
MADILANPMKICFGSFTATSITLAAATSPTASVKAQATSDAAPKSSKKSKTHPAKPYDTVQGMERVIDMMEETLQIYERAQLNARCVAPQDLPFRTMTTQRRVRSSGGEVDPYPIWVTTTIWRPEG